MDEKDRLGMKLREKERAEAEDTRTHREIPRWALPRHG